MPAPTPGQVRDYILTMLEGLSGLSDCAGDRATGERLRQFADSLITAWSPRSDVLRRGDFGRLDELVTAYAEEQPDALALVLARIERPAPPPRASTPVRMGPEALHLPRALARRGVGPRRFVAPGVWIAPVPSRHADGWRTYLLRAPAGVAVPHHDHHGPEFTVLLRGAYVDDTVRYGEGDFTESGPGQDHSPQAEPDGPCICLISGQGGIKASGWVRLVKPLLGV